MVYWVRDTTRRFRERPFYGAEEIDRECERMVVDFLMRHKGGVAYPLTDDELTVLVERHVDDLDLYADLSAEGDDVEGVCRFALGRKPVIQISGSLSTDGRRSNRLRTTLAHELGHAALHDKVFQMTFSAGDLFGSEREAKVVCKRGDMTDAPESDWMEWQACYASGAFLMPKLATTRRLRPEVERIGRLPPFHVADPAAATLITCAVDTFSVSRDAARVRLSKLGYLTQAVPVPTLFG